MSSNDTDRAERLRRMGVDEDEFGLVEQLWNGPVLYLIQDQRTATLASLGYGAFESFDAIWHELQEANAHLYMQHHLTPHQAHLLESSRQAQRNLWGPNDDTDRAHRILDAPMDHVLQVELLLVAESPDETDALLNACIGEVDDHKTNTPEAAISTIEARAANLPHRIDVCDCPASD